MATSIVRNFTSGRWYPSANPINATVTSNFSGKCNFRYICDVYINGTKVYTSKLFPEPSTGYGFFQISRIIQDYIETYINVAPPISIFSNATVALVPTSAVSVYCRFGEEYDSSTTCDGTIVQYNNQVQSATFYVFEGAIDYEDFLTFDYSDYLLTSNTSNKFLTNSPRTQDVSYNDSYFLDMISVTGLTSLHKLRVITTDITGATASYDLTNQISAFSSKRYRFAVGPYDINANRFDNALSPIITQYTKSYTIQLIYNSSVEVSEVFTFKVNKPGEFVTRFAFVGLLGGIEHFTFYHRNKKAFNIDRKNYDRTLQSNISSNWTYAVGDRGATTYKVSAQETHAVATFCSEDNSEWLYEMWLSPTVWTYKRSELIEWRIFREDATPISRMLFWLPKGHGLQVGDVLLCLPSTDPNFIDYQDSFTVTGIEGNNVVDCGLTFNIYNATETACGYLYNTADWKTLPVVISDANIEVKQKLGRPIDYSLNYSMAYMKNTLRG